MNIITGGVIFGIVIFLPYCIWYVAYMPRWFKRWIMRSKYRLFGLDLTVSFLAGKTINTFGNTLTAGVGMGTVMLLSCIMSALMLTYVVAKEKVTNLW